IIDDCALARRLKAQGPIWLGLTRRATSLRPYGGFLKIGRMISRSAYAQLGYSPLALARTVAAMAVVYLAPALPAIAAAYSLFTVQSAVDFWRGRGGLWKGRVQAMAGDAGGAPATFPPAKGRRTRTFRWA